MLSYAANVDCDIRLRLIKGDPCDMRAAFIFIRQYCMQTVMQLQSKFPDIFYLKYFSLTISTGISSPVQI